MNKSITKEITDKERLDFIAENNVSVSFGIKEWHAIYVKDCKYYSGMDADLREAIDKAIFESRDAKNNT